MARFQKANIDYIKRVTKHIEEIGRLSATDLHILDQYRRLDLNIEQLEREIAKACNMSKNELSAMINKQARDIYSAQKKWYVASGVKQVAFSKNTRATKLAQSIFNRTFGSLRNISRTTSIKNEYKAIVDEATLLVSNGTQTFDKAISSSLSRLQNEGIKIQTYENGRYRPVEVKTKRVLSPSEAQAIMEKEGANAVEYEFVHNTRRLDSALRMNIKEATRSITQGMLELTGREFGADGMEIDAHEPCAEDHIEIQGWHGTIEEYENLNNSLDRPIGELNCGHEATPIKLDAYEPTYTDEQLEEMKNASRERIDIYEDGRPDDKQPTRYQCSQKMRELETKIREQKENYMGGNRDIATQKLKKYRKQYDYISAKSGLPKSPRKMKVSGYTGRY